MIKIITLIPKFDNDGNKIPKEVFRWFEDKILEIAGGFSEGPTISGGWQDKGEIYRDYSKEYIIAAQTTKQVKEIKQLVIEVGRITKQKTMYFETIPQAKIEILEVK